MTTVTQNNLVKVASHLFGQSEMDFWRDERGDIYMTSEQIGTALDYGNPRVSIGNLFERNRARLEPNSTVIKLMTVDTRERDVRIFNEKGIYEIIRKSDQPKADQFYDWVYEMLQTIRKTGSYTVRPVTDERQARVELFKTAIDHEERINGIEQRVERVERNTTLDYREQEFVRRAVAKRVHEFASGDERKELFSQLHREIKDRWGVASYKDVKRVELQQVIQYINAWRPRLELGVQV